MNKILNAVQKLTELTFVLPRNSELKTPEIEKTVERLEKFVDDFTPATSDELKNILAKWKNGNRNFRHKEIKKLPFIMYDSSISLNDMSEIFRLMNFSGERQLKNLILAYLLNYDTSNKTKLLQQKILLVFNNEKNLQTIKSKMLEKIYRARNFILSDNCMGNMSQLYLKSDLNNALEITGLSSDFIKSSKFVQKSVKNFFVNPVSDIEKRLKILDTLNNESGIYENIFPEIADVLIRNVAESQNFEILKRGKEKCIEVFYKNLGDPRFGKLKFKWNRVSQNSREIFLHWLAEKDLNLFFQIIEQTALDRMWRYRKNFWKAYLPYISNTWVFLGRDAQDMARNLDDKIISHGKLEGGVANQSVLVFQIGNFAFTEWSHNGKLRVYTAGNAHNFFGRKRISREDIVNSRYVMEWIHSAPQAFSWQNKVGEWIRVNCGIYKTQKDWK